MHWREAPCIWNFHDSCQIELHSCAVLLGPEDKHLENMDVVKRCDVKLAPSLFSYVSSWDIIQN